MDLNTFRAANLLLSIVMVGLYGTLFIRLMFKRQDRALQLTRLTLLFLFLILLFGGVVQTFIYYGSIFGTLSTEDSAVIANIKNMFVNFALILDAALLYIISKE